MINTTVINMFEALFLSMGNYFPCFLLKYFCIKLQSFEKPYGEGPYISVSGRLIKYSKNHVIIVALLGRWVHYGSLKTHSF